MPRRTTRKTGRRKRNTARRGRTVRKVSRTARRRKGRTVRKRKGHTVRGSKGRTVRGRKGRTVRKRKGGGETDSEDTLISQEPDTTTHPSLESHHQPRLVPHTTDPLDQPKVVLVSDPGGDRISFRTMAKMLHTGELSPEDKAFIPPALPEDAQVVSEIVDMDEVVEMDDIDELADLFRSFVPSSPKPHILKKGDKLYRAHVKGYTSNWFFTNRLDDATYITFLKGISPYNHGKEMVVDTCMVKQDTPIEDFRIRDLDLDISKLFDTKNNPKVIFFNEHNITDKTIINSNISGYIANDPTTYINSGMNKKAMEEVYIRDPDTVISCSAPRKLREPTRSNKPQRDVRWNIFKGQAKAALRKRGI